MSTRIIKINRGDTYIFDIDVTEQACSNKKHLLEADEAVYFALMYPHQPFDEALLIKS